jgi:predicted ArsR family transcriptional regulator
MPTANQIVRRHKVLAHLQANPGATARQVSEALGIHYTTANDDLHVLLTAGKVSCSQQGRDARTWRAT